MEILKVIEGNIADILGSSPASENVLILAKADDLREFANTLIRRSERNLEKSLQQKDDDERPMTEKEAEKFLHKTRKTLRMWRYAGVIKAHRIGGRIYYKKSELIAALRDTAAKSIR